jgi:hypothetical protein
MTGTPLDLISLIRVGAGLLSPSKAKVPPASPDGSFAHLLRKAEQGELASGREVTVGKGVDLKLAKEQVSRLSAAADRAEASGAMNVMVLMDGMALKLDVQNRTIIAKADAAPGQVMTGVDAVVSLDQGENAPSFVPPTLPYPGGSGAMNPSLAKAIASRN